jgi:HSP20 family protein
MTTAMTKRQNARPATFGNVVDDIFQNSLRHFFDDNFWGAGQSVMSSVPVNVREKEQQYEVDVIAPGCRKEDFNVNISDNVLTVSFEHDEKKNEEDQKNGWVRNEYQKRSFSRSFTLDETVDINNVKASYADGILRLTLPKSERAKQVSKNIEIQ